MLKAWVNFPISGKSLPLEFWHAYAEIKRAAALANAKIGKLDKSRARAIVRACDEIQKGKLDKSFTIDVFQAGAGTSTNMRLNEVIARRAHQIAKLNISSNDHVNLSQSTNDTFHATTHLVVLDKIFKELLPTLQTYQEVLNKRIIEFKAIIKTGHTHLQEAVPLTLGQAFSGFSIEKIIAALKSNKIDLLSLPLGGTAVGTGLNAGPKFSQAVFKELNQHTKYKFIQAKNHFAAMQNLSAEVQISSQLRSLAISFTKIANDFRLLSSGPNAGFGELNLPAVQRGSSIMPGKINPTIPEVLNMVCFQVMGHDHVISQASAAGQLELNVFMPLVAHNLLEAITILTRGVAIFTQQALKGVKPNIKKIKENLEKNVMIITTLTSEIGYEKATALAHKAYKENVPVTRLLKDSGLLSDQKIKQLLNLKRLTNPN